MPRVQELQKFESLPEPDFAKQHTVRPVAERGLEKVADGDGWRTVLLAPGFKPDKVFMPQLNLSRIFNKQNAFIRRNEFSQGRQQRGFLGICEIGTEEPEPAFQAELVFLAVEFAPIPTAVAS